MLMCESFWGDNYELGNWGGRGKREQKGAGNVGAKGGHLTTVFVYFYMISFILQNFKTMTSNSVLSTKPM